MNFEKIYEIVKENCKNDLKEARKVKQNIIIVTIVFLLIVNVFLYLLLKVKEISILAMLVSIFIIFILLIYGNVFYRERYKNDVIRTLVKAYDEKLYFDSKYGILERIYKESEFDRKYNHYHSEDRIFGKIIDSNFQIAEVETTEIITHKKNGHYYTESHKVFSGLFGYIKLNKDISSTINLYTNSSGNRYNKDRIEVDSAEFEQYYDLITQNKVLALKIFTSDLIEKFNELKKEYPKYDFELKIVNDNVYFRLNCGRDLFEPPIIKSDIDKKLLERYFKLIYYPIEVSKKLVENINRQ